MAVAFYVTGISTPEVHPEFPPLLGTLTGVAANDLLTRTDEMAKATVRIIEIAELLGVESSTSQQDCRRAGLPQAGRT
jgi:hypothetical protein